MRQIHNPLPLSLYSPINFTDANGDGKTGLEEAIYSLQKVAGQR
jgi:recombinational DNA repair ATPase RecF